MTQFGNLGYLCSSTANKILVTVSIKLNCYCYEVMIMGLGRMFGLGIQVLLYVLAIDSQLNSLFSFMVEVEKKKERLNAVLQEWDSTFKTWVGGCPFAPVHVQ